MPKPRPEAVTASSWGRARGMIRSLFGHRLYNPAEASDSHVAGFGRDLLLAYVYNDNARNVLLERHPSLVGVLFERNLGTDIWWSLSSAASCAGLTW